jgi:hypothetical protein
MQRRYVYMIECNVQNGWNRTGEVFDLALFDSPVARRGRPALAPRMGAVSALLNSKSALQRVLREATTARRVLREGLPLRKNW